ncbi:DUF3710 domain-containing protein [Planctomonas psychrotolerans]|uniref:DUF3710 domain-containing protein n=1 Tax=Planctomonas psychrotolerans TaxID=2528712 RepID=UPI00123889DD|nr:DUF3710 domain-containing protein [Planctomonas psychrotolerans]
MTDPQSETPQPNGDPAAEAENADTRQPKSAPADRAESGPFDDAEANAVRPYVDLGGVRILPREGLHLRLEVAEGTQRVVAVGLEYAGSSLQVQPFAAPRSSGLWHEIRGQIIEQIQKQGGTTALTDGPFGPELLAEIPAVVTAGAPPTTRIARFIGVDGPRWFLRGVITGAGATQQEAAERIEDLFRSVVVVRGTAPMPPRDLIPLSMPQNATLGQNAAAGQTAPGQTPPGQAAPGQTPPTGRSTRPPVTNV